MVLGVCLMALGTILLGSPVIATLEGVANKQAGVAKVKQGLERYLQNIKYDEVVATQRGARPVTGTGSAKKSGVAVVFAAAVIDTAPGQVAGLPLFVNARIEDLCKETVDQICQTIRVGDQLTEKR